ncbi:hypothetical protein GCM10009557_23770 [Virgisporangium ochraceum]|uniref:Heat shock protein 70 n=1 Tax=Virgisporangium ochraceum TaxID=65505 RepID=A0A8J4E8N1_9ACTN|nr:extracellular solute-binding protein [Virgisporangium ochraceum]GIJ65861.1 hypothetical protein Voc01_007780 [Virgisporangium ochraceum]
MHTNDGAAGWRLAVDFGTSNTVAVLRHGDGESRPLLFDGSPLLPSAVCLGPDGDLLVGRDALQQALATPSWCEPTPKRRVGEQSVLLGRRQVPVVDLVAAVLHRVLDEAVGMAGTRPDELVMTHPDGWGEVRREVLARAAEKVALPRPRYLSEPAAAANLFPTLRGADVAVPGPDHRPGTDRAVLIYDFGGGTFDVSVVRWDPDGVPEVLRSEGLATVGGIDLDDRIVTHLGSELTADAVTWQRLLTSQDEDDRRARWQLREGVREAKERLSRLPRVDLHIPVLDVRVTLTRTEFDRLARPVVTRTVELTTATLDSAGVTPTQLAGVYLVGGSSRVPLVATMLVRALRVEPRVLRQPDLAVAEGAALAFAGAPVTPAPSDPEPEPSAPPAPRRFGRRRVLAMAAAVAAAGATGGVVLSLSDKSNGGHVPRTGPSPARRPGTLTLLAGTDPSPAGTRQDLVDQWNDDHQIQVTITPVPGSADDQVSAMWSDPVADVFLLDAPQLSRFANAGLITALPDGAVDVDRFLERPLNTCRWRDRYWALPFNTDVGLLFHRPDVPAPTGWPDLVTLARAAGRPSYSGQFTADESSVVNMLEAALAHNPKLLNDDGTFPDQISVAEWDAAIGPLREAIAAGAVLDAHADLATVDLPPDERSAEFLSVRHATWSQVQTVRLWPAFATRLSGLRPGRLFGPAILGGQNLAVSSRSANPEAAIDLIRYLTDDKRQRKLTTDQTYAPVTKSAYETDGTDDRNRAHLILSAIQTAYPRPVTPSYSEVAQVFIELMRPAVLNGTRLPEHFAKSLHTARMTNPTSALPTTRAQSPTPSPT